MRSSGGVSGGVVNSKNRHSARQAQNTRITIPKFPRKTAPIATNVDVLAQGRAPVTTG